MVALGLALAGLTMLIMAFFAKPVHFNLHQVWGSKRIALAFLGMLFLLAFVIVLNPPFLKRLLKSSFLLKAKRLVEAIKVPFLWLFEPRQEKKELRRRASVWYAVAGATIAIIISLWYFTSGKMTVWVPYSNYFDLQADGFLAGKLSLLEKPPAALLALENPYTSKKRATISYIWDASLFKGSYYLYWGPVPALMAAVVKLFHPAWIIEDQYLIFFSISGLAIVLAALFYWLQTRYLPKIPGWVVLGLTLLGVLNTPVFWLVNRPDVYEAAIAVGQFFLILGFYTAIRGLASEKHRLLLLVLAGFFWGAAIGSRVELGLGIAWMVLLVCLFLILKSRKRARFMIGSILAVILPMVIWGAGLAWFNYARFGNILETGHRYQLTRTGVPSDIQGLFSASFILPNLYSLLARPFEYSHAFPFFHTPSINYAMWPSLFFPHNPNYYYVSQTIAGIFVAIPAIWFLLIPLIIIPTRAFRDWLKDSPRTSPPLKDQPLPIWMAWMAFGTVLLNLTVLATFLTTSMRYEADLLPLLTILLALTLGWLSTYLHTYPRIWRIILFILVISILISIMISLLTNFQNTDYLFKNHNPQLYKAISHFFGRK